MPILSQSNFPRAWLIFQNLIGGNGDKQRLALKHYQGQRRILEVGCSVGNISSVFSRYPDVNFTGVDIDGKAIAHARRRFRDRPGFRFLEGSLADLAHDDESFDYILFAGILHHVDDGEARKLLRDGISMISPGGLLVLYEPDPLRPTDGLAFRLFYRLEQGAFLRDAEHLCDLVRSSGAKVISCEERLVSMGILRHPKVARFDLIAAQP